VSYPPERLTSNAPLDVVPARLMPEAVAERVNVLCHMRKTPTLLYGIFTDLLRHVYSQPEGFVFEVPARRVWDPDTKKSGIWIDSELEWDPQAIEKRPAVYVALSPIQYRTASGGSDAGIGMDLENGEYYYSRIGTGHVSFNHVGTTKGEGAALAGFTLDVLDAFSTPVRREMNFETLALSQISSLTLDKESRERYRSVVDFTYSFQDTWTLKLESPKLKRIVMDAWAGLVRDIEA